MGIMNDMSRDQMQARIKELSNMEQNGDLSAEGREELARLRSNL